MSHTHRAVIEDAGGHDLVVIAAGSREHCEESLDAWLAKHPLGENQESFILEDVGRIDELDEGQRLLVIGNPIDGFEFFGPFTDEEESVIVDSDAHDFIRSDEQTWWFTDVRKTPRPNPFASAL